MERGKLERGKLEGGKRRKRKTEEFEDRVQD